MLRYDVKNGFRTKYFQSCFGGYVLGLSATLFVMIYFNVRTGLNASRVVSAFDFSPL